jgi:hypothetical protein
VDKHQVKGREVAWMGDRQGNKAVAARAWRLTTGGLGASEGAVPLVAKTRHRLPPGIGAYHSTVAMRLRLPLSMRLRVWGSEYSRRSK